MRKLCICVLVAAALCGCQTNEFEYQGVDQGVFTAVIDDVFFGGAKTSLDRVGNVLWKKGDRMSIFEGSTINQQYQVADESDGKTAAVLTPVNPSGFVAGGEIDNNIAFYPYTSTAGIAKTEDAYIISELVLPATQTYADASFGNGAFPMVAVTTSALDKNLKFKNILGGLKLQLTGRASVASISVTGNSGEILCGSATVTAANGSIPSIELAETLAKTVTLDCGSVALDETTPTSFIIALPPMTMSGGFTVTVIDTENKQMQIKTNKSQTISRSEILKMPAVTYVGATVPEPFTLTSTGNTSVSIAKNASPEDVALEYRKGSESWAAYSIGDAIELADGESMQFRAGDGGNTRFSTDYSNYYNVTVKGSGTVAASGNVMSLLNSAISLDNVPDYCFYYLFNYCNNLVDASQLKLPASSIGQDSYHGMFLYCSSLTSAPELPATSLAQNCYNGMFYGCTSLISAPELPATTLAKSCYNSMFMQCTKLSCAPDLPAGTMAESCYYRMFYGCTKLVALNKMSVSSVAESCCEEMFYGCTKLNSVPKLDATVLALRCYECMFYGCASLTEAMELPSTKLANFCYNNMFFGCTNLAEAPDLPASSLAYGCYSGMFGNCTSLRKAPKLRATTLKDYCYCKMFSGCVSLTEAPELPATVMTKSCYTDMFTKCTRLTEAPALPATTLAEACYLRMFSECSSLITPPVLPAMTLANACYNQMFYRCSNMASAPDLPATTLSDFCYSNMFALCRSLTKAPDLLAITLARGCYGCMFDGCSGINYVKAMFTTEPSDSYTENWLRDVASEGKFVKNADATWEVTGANGIPDGWTVEAAKK